MQHETSDNFPLELDISTLAACREAMGSLTRGVSSAQRACGVLHLETLHKAKTFGSKIM
jgi:hypothetical protein